MKKSVFQTAPARALILTLAIGSLGGYVALVSCSRTTAPPAPSAPSAPSVPNAAPAQQAIPPAQNENKNEGPSNTGEAREPRLYGPATKSGIVLPQRPKRPPLPQGRLYGPATKSDILIAPPQQEIPHEKPVLEILRDQSKNNR